MNMHIVLIILLLMIVGEHIAAAPVNAARIVNIFPHDTSASTQGLIVHDGFFYESTGIKGRSSLRKVVIATGTVVQSHALGSKYYGEGLTFFDKELIQLTWKNRVGFIYDVADFKKHRQFTYPPSISSGWGITHDGKHLLISDGSATIHLLEPETFKVFGRIVVFDQGTQISSLNELEYINGEIWANIWQTNVIARISPKTGHVIAWVDLSSLLPHRGSGGVLNGIAYEQKSNRIFVTGKLWPKVFEIALDL